MERYRTDPDAMRKIPLLAPGGEQVALEQVARIEVKRGPELINREQGQRRIVVMSNVRGRDLNRSRGRVANRVFHRVRRAVRKSRACHLPIGHDCSPRNRTFSSAKLALPVVANVPFALVGGIAALWVRGMNLNLSASIGFITLFGVGMLNGVVLVSSIKQLRKAGAAFGDGCALC
jgi:heavy metal efflux system protein